MAKYYGDLPCVRIGNTIHITENAFRCVCDSHGAMGDQQTGRYYITVTSSGGLWIQSPVKNVDRYIRKEK